jgi:lactoylglutathione lyase
MTKAEILVMRFELFVRDKSLSLDFYEQVLGFSLKPPATRSSSYAQVVNGKVQIGLCDVDSLAANHYFRTIAGDHPGLGVEIVFEVSDLAGYERRAQLAGAIYEPLRFRPWGRRDFRLVDPDGYYIRVTETR